jgi:hypothetical protein
MMNFDVVKTALRDECASRTHSILASLDAYHASRWTDPGGEKVEAPSRATADLEDAASSRYPNLIEQPLRLVAKLLCLLLQALLLRAPVAEEVFITFSHHWSPILRALR